MINETELIGLSHKSLHSIPSVSRQREVGNHGKLQASRISAPTLTQATIVLSSVALSLTLTRSLPPSEFE